MTEANELSMSSALRERYPEVERFAERMRRELWANHGKGDQNVWQNTAPRVLVEDCLYHLAKLSRALRDEPALIAELCADVANMAMMVGESARVQWET